MFRIKRPNEEGGKIRTQNESYKLILIELILYILFLIIVTIVTLLQRTVYMYYFYDMIERLFIKRIFYGRNDVELLFDEIATVEDWWAFIYMGLENGIHMRYEYVDIEAGSFFDSILLGPPRLRQLRVKNNTCIIHKEFMKQFSSCYGAYTFANEDTSSENTGSQYYTASQLDALPTWGLLTVYRGGGLVESLTFNLEKNLEIISNLTNNLWINRSTRLVIFEFAIFNANVNLFCVVKFQAEIAPVGGVVPSYNIQTYRLTYLWSAVDYFYFICYGIFIIQIIYFSVEEVMEIHHERFRYLTYKWNYLDLIVILIGYLSLFYTIFRFFYMDYIFEKYKKDPKNYLSLDIISFMEFNYNNMMGICAFLVWIKIFKYLSFSKTMIQFGTTFRRCSKDLFAFGLMFIIAFIAFAQLGYLIFGTETFAFRTFIDAIFTLMRTLVGDFDYDAIERANRILGPIFFLVYIVFVFFILLNMFVAIIIDTYSAVKAEITIDNIKLGFYVKKILGKMCKWCCCGRNVFKFKEDADIDELSFRQSSQPRGSVDKSRKPDNFQTDKLNPAQKKTIEKYFEEVEPYGRPPENLMDKTELNRINKRIDRMEDVMDRMVARLDALVGQLDAARVHGQRL